MSDPLSVSAGIAGLLTIAGSTVSTCYSYGCLLRDGPAEVRKLVEETMSLAGVLNAVKALVDRTTKSTLDDTGPDATGVVAPPPPYSASEAQEHFQQLVEPIAGTESVLKQVQEALLKADIYQEPNRLGRLVKRLRWPLKRESTLDFVERLERYKNLFVLALDTTHLAITMDVQRTLEDIRQGQILDRLERRTTDQMHKLRQSFQWLCPVNFVDAHRDARRLHLQGTGSWILKLPEWQSWAQRDRAFLWLYGIPGSGKTVMTSTLVEQCLSYENDKRAHVAYFYCDFRNKESQKPENVLGGLIIQLCAQISTPIPEYEQFVKAHLTHGQELSKPSCEALEQLLLAVLGHTQRAMIIIDALDECTDRAVLLHLLTALPNAKGSHVKVLVSSRQEGDIEAALAPFERLSSRVDAQQADIQFYVSCSMANSSRLSRLQPELRLLVQQTLVDSAQGMFRWVQCQIDSLSRLHTDRDVRRAVHRLPPTLYETYERIMTRIAEPDRITARRALLWLACAPRQLRISELTEAVAIDDDTTSRDPEAVWAATDLLSVIGSLARYSPATQGIELAHHSVKEYLVSPTVTHQLGEFQFDDDAGRAELAERMLLYLLMDDFAAPCNKRAIFIQRLESYPLFHLAARYWPFYARGALHSGNERLARLAARLLTPEPNGHFWSWIEALIAQGPASFKFLQRKGHDRIISTPAASSHWRPVPDNLQPLYYAASFGLTPLVIHLAKNGADLNARAGQFRGTALHAAVFRNHADIVELLLRLGANPRLGDIHGDTPWDLAMLVGAQSATLHALQSSGAYEAEKAEKPQQSWWDFSADHDAAHAAYYESAEAADRPMTDT